VVIILQLQQSLLDGLQLTAQLSHQKAHQHILFSHMSNKVRHIFAYAAMATKANFINKILL
jgi:hypothetical protein